MGEAPTYGKDNLPRDLFGDPFRGLFNKEPTKEIKGLRYGT